MTEGRYEAVIVGAGIAGLTAAWTLRDRRILVLEATDRVGGRLRSEPRGTYWLNLGAHLFGGPRTLMGRLATEMGLETRPIPGNRMGIALRGRVFASGRPETYPFRLPLSLGARLSFAKAGLRLRAAAQEHIRVPRAPDLGSRRPRPGRASSPTGTTRPSLPTSAISIPTSRRSSGPMRSASRRSPRRSRPGTERRCSRSSGATTRREAPATSSVAPSSCPRRSPTDWASAS